PPVSQIRSFKQFPDEDIVVGVSPFVVIRSMDRRYHQDVLVVDYVNGRFVRRPHRERTLLETLVKEPMTLAASMKPLRRKLETLHRFGVVVVRDRQINELSADS